MFSTRTPRVQTAAEDAPTPREPLRSGHDRTAPADPAAAPDWPRRPAPTAPPSTPCSTAPCVGHFALVAEDGTPAVIPTAVVRDGDRVLATARRARAGCAGSPAACPRRSRSRRTTGWWWRGAPSSPRSATARRSLFGSCTHLTEDKERVLDLVTERLLPGRVAEVRRPTKAELAATLVLAAADRGLVAEDLRRLARGRGPTTSPGPAWAGVVPVREVYDAPLAAPDLARGHRRTAVGPGADRLNPAATCVCYEPRSSVRRVAGSAGAGASGSCSDRLLQAAEAGLELVGSEVTHGRMDAQAQPFEHLTAGAGGRLDHPAEARHAPAGRRERRDHLVQRLEHGGVHLVSAGEVLQPPPRRGDVVAEVLAQQQPPAGTEHPGQLLGRLAACPRRGARTRTSTRSRRCRTAPAGPRRSRPDIARRDAGAAPPRSRASGPTARRRSPARTLAPARGCTYRSPTRRPARPADAAREAGLRRR